MGMPTTTTNNSIRDNNGNDTTLGRYRINKDRAVKATIKALDFFNPTEDFLGIIECKGNIRHIAKRGEMREDLDVIDCKIIVGQQTRKIEEWVRDSIHTHKKEERYENQDVSLILNKAVLLSKFKRLQEELQNLAGRRIVIVGLGKVEDKSYYDYYVELEEKARQDGVLQEIGKL